MIQQILYTGKISGGEFIKSRIKRVKEPFSIFLKRIQFFLVLYLLWVHWLEQQRAKCWRKSQRIDSRYQYRCCQCVSKLLIKNTRWTLHKTYREKYGSHNHRNR